MILKELISILEKEFPVSIAEEWDNVGLVIGDEKKEIKNIQLSLDLTEKVIDKAIENKVELIITHHPLIFSPIKKINNKDILGRKILKLIENGINVYTLHTNLDSALNGLNEYVAKKLNGKNIKVLNEQKDELYRMSIYTSLNLNEMIKNLINDFTELKYRNIILDNGKYKIEIVGKHSNLNILLNKMKQIDKSKELIYDLVKLENKYKTGIGIGRIFEVDKIEFENYIEIIKKTFEIKKLKIVKSNDKLIKKVVIVNGSGAGMWKKARRIKADLFITGDIKYHEALDAFEEGLNLVDIGHYESEHFFWELLIKKIGDNLKVEVYNEKEIFEFR